jgi:hypothetical protein
MESNIFYRGQSSRQMFHGLFCASNAGLLNDAVEFHFRSFRSLPFGVEYLHRLNPDFLLQIVKEAMLYAPNTVIMPWINSSFQALFLYIYKVQGLGGFLNFCTLIVVTSFLLQ